MFFFFIQKTKIPDALPFRRPTPTPTPTPTTTTTAPPPPRPPARRPAHTRFIALQLFYLGWDFAGFTSQGRADDGTVEAALFAALRRTGLIPPRGDGGPSGVLPPLVPPELDYSRCGRTDRGVSGVGQVVALRVRSRLGPEGVPEGVKKDEIGDSDSEEIDYVRTLNGALPQTIRVTAWAPAPPGFSARFSASWRRYRYFLVDDCAGGGNGGGNAGRTRLDVGAMRAAAAHLVGTHDFRNFCRADIPAVTNFTRTLLDLTVDRVGGGCDGEKEEGECASIPNPAPDPAAPPRRPHPPSLLSAVAPPPGMDAVLITVTGSAFLWHQVRCLVHILHLVGRGLEPPSITADLLDVGGAFPAKPQYKMSPERPLLFCGAAFGGGELAWRYSDGGGNGVNWPLAGVRELLRASVAGTLLLAAAAAEVEAEAGGGGGDGEEDDSAALAPAAKRRVAAVTAYRPLASRPRDPPLEARLAARGLALAAGPPTRPMAVGVDGRVLSA
jgi:tRNA pseudouridine38/39 synthase